MRGPRAVTLALSLLLGLGRAGAAGVWDEGGGGVAFALAVDPSKPGTVYAGTERGGIAVSTDGGRSWRQLAEHGERIWTLAVTAAGAVYAGTADGRILRSVDAGASWTAAEVVPGRGEVWSLVADPRATPAVIYAATAAGEVRRSLEGGTTWTATRPGADGEAVRALAIDLRRRPSLVWAGTKSGVYRHVARTGRWRKINALAVRELTVDPTRPRTLFGVSGGVVRSTDKGRTWREVEGIRHALSLVIDPTTTPGTVYAGTSYQSVLKSTDGGETWTAAANGLSRWAEVVELAIDPRTAAPTLYAATSHLGVHRSTDGGASWQADESR